MTEKPSFRFLTDEDVPDSVGEVLAQAGHIVARVRDNMVMGSADKVVAAAARENNHVLVTHNYRDFRNLVREHLEATNKKVDTLSRIELICKQPHAARRIGEELPLIELELSRPRSAGVRITIRDSGIAISRI